MAVRTVSDTGGNYNSTGTWVEGAVPTSADDVVFTATSGPLTINVASAAKSIVFTNYVNTITFNAELTVSGAVNLGTGGYTQAGAFGITVNTGAVTLTSGGVTWSRTWTFAGTSQTWTISGTWTFTGNLIFAGASSVNINSGTFNIGSNLTVGSAVVQGSTALVYNGTGTWSTTGTGELRNNLTINTSGTLTISGTVYYGGGTLTYTAGTVVTSGSTIQMNSSTTFNTSTLSWNIVQIQAGSAVTFTMSSNLTVYEFWAWINSGGSVAFSGANRFTTCTNLYLGALGSGATWNLPNNITCTGLAYLGNLTTTTTINRAGGTLSAPSFTFPMTTGNVLGTCTLVVAGGNGTITGSSNSTGAGRVTSNITFNNTGTTTLSGTLNFCGTTTYTAGTVNAGSSVLFVASTNPTYNTNGIKWNEIRCVGTRTINSNSTTAAALLNYQVGTIITWAGTAGFSVDNWTISNVTTNAHVLNSGRTYTVNSAFTANSAVGNVHVSLRASTPGSAANLTVVPGATLNLSYIDFTDINASGGRTVWVFDPVLSGTTNIRALNDLVTIGI